MSARDLYRAELGAAIAALLAGRVQVTLAQLEQELATGAFAHDLPGRPTLAKAVTRAGWVKVEQRGSSALYKDPIRAPTKVRRR